MIIKSHSRYASTKQLEKAAQPRLIQQRKDKEARAAERAAAAKTKTQEEVQRQIAALAKKKRSPQPVKA